MIEFNGGEFGVVLGIHTLVTELSADFVHLVKTAHDATLQVKFGCDTEIHIDVQSVVVGDEGACVCATCKGVEHGSFHFIEAFSVKEFSYCRHDFAALDEEFLHFGVGDEVNVALAVSQFRIGESVILFRKREQ